jgi:DNA-binding CsgD family transcriptional regulator
VVQLARGLTALGGGRHDDAYRHLARMFDPADPSFHPMESAWAIGSLAEAAVHSGHQRHTRGTLADLEPMAARMPSPWLHAAMRHARALLADGDDAEKLFQAALDADLTRWPFERARALLAYGQWLRRQRRVAESRAPLRAARDAFDMLGTAAWGQRARQELRAAGEASRERLVTPWHKLSPQELQIAKMAAGGLTNRQISQHLYISSRTVGAHLYRIFPKLGITARAQLATTLYEDGRGPG